MLPRAVPLVTCFIVLAALLTAQDGLTPWPSPAASTSLVIGTTTVTLRFHRPAVKGRDLSKELANAVPVWRLGANEATTLEVTDPVTIAGHELAAGTYSLFATIRADGWTIIVNRKAQQWGSYFYDAKDDVLRFDLKPETAAVACEWMDLAIDPVDQQNADVTFRWDKIRWSFRIHVDVDAIVDRNLAAALKSRKKDDVTPLLKAAMYYSQKGIRLPEALAWAEEARVLSGSFWAWEWKGRILKQLGHGDEAVACVTQALEAAKGKAPEGYLDGLRKLLSEWGARAK